MTEAGRRLLEGNFVIGPWTDPRTRVADDLTAPQFVAAIEAIEREAYEQAKADAIAAVGSVDGLSLAPHREVRNDAIVERKAVIAAIRDLKP
jgi:hypothetical protein